MSTLYRQPDAGHYRLARGIRVTARENSSLAICNYPLRAVRLSITTARLLQQCAEQHTCEELAEHFSLSLKRVQVLCEQLHWKGLLEAGPKPPPLSWPGVSIIIPSHNRAAQLERCLRSLCELNYPTQSLEVLVVDDASNDETNMMLAQVGQEFEARGRTLRVVHHLSQQGVARSRNTGAAAAQHELLAYIDSDCVASPGWLAELIPIFQEAKVAAVGGMIRAFERKSLFGRYEDVRSSLFMGVRSQQVSIEGPLKYLPTANLLVRREMWQRIGGFAPLTFGEDVDFCRRLLAIKGQMIYLPQGVVYHDYRTRLRAFLSIRAAYASAEAALLQIHSEERRVLILPLEQATFAGLAVGGLWFLGVGLLKQKDRSLMEPDGRPQGPNHFKGNGTGDHKGPRPYYTTMPDASVYSRGGSGRGCGGWALVAARPGPVPRPWCLFEMIWPLWPPVRAYMFLLALILTLLGAYKRWRKVRQQRIPIGPFTILRATVRGHLAYTYHLCRHLTRYYTLPLLMIGLLLPPLLLLLLILVGIVVGVDYARLRPTMSLGEYALCAILDDCAYEVGVVWGCVKHGTWKPLWPVVRYRSHR